MLQSKFTQSIFATGLLLLLLPSVAALAAPAPIFVPPNTPVESGTTASLKLNPTSLSLIGCAAPNAFVTFIEDERPVGTVVASSDGQFTKVLGAQKYGLHSIKAYYEDARGYTSATTNDTVSLGAHGNTTLPMFLPPTANVTPANVDAGETITITGTTIPFAVVNITIDNNDTLIANANSIGEWSIKVNTLQYFIGLHTFRVRSGSNVAPCYNSDRSNKYQFRVSSRSPRDDHTSSDEIPKLKPPIILEPKDLYLTSTPSVLLEGTAEPNTQLEVFVDGIDSGSIFTNARGTWQFPLEMTKRQHSIFLRACFKGVCSDNSKEITVFYNGDFAGCTLDFRLGGYRYWGVSPRDGIDIELLFRGGAARHDVVIDWGDTTVEHLNLYRDDEKKFHHVYQEQGQFNGIITLGDENGCVQTEYFSVNVGPRNARKNYSWLLLALLPPATALLVRNALIRKESHVIVRHTIKPKRSVD